MIRRFILLLAFVSPLGAQVRQTGYVPGALTPHQLLTRDIYKQLIEINTGDKTGKVTPAAIAMAQRFRDAGIADSDIFVGGPRPEKHNVVARIHGRPGSTRKPLLLLAHIDVVEALKADWSADLDPFVFTERDGYYYGRGTADDKAMAAIFVANVFRLKKEGYVPDRDVIVALTADEEGGTANGVEWLLENHPKLVDAGVVLNEGGGGTTRGGKPFLNSVQATEKVFANITLRATNRGGHSSVPRADNAITSLADALAKVGRYSFPIQLNEVTRAFFTRTADVESPEMGRAMKALVANPNDAAAVRVVTSDPRYNSMLRTTCVATMLKGGHAENALPQLAEANVNCRMFPGDTPEGTRDALAKLVNDTTVQVLSARDDRPKEPPTALLPEVMEPITRITHEMFGDIPVIPTMSTGATDSRYFRQRNVPAFGVSGIFSDPLVDARAHGRDERMRIQSFFEGQEFLYRLTKALADKPAVTP
ncbi:MAG TPA: M20/M25/M40 family metallo-hydrolase [Gemmatimonadaceae bacterium]|nr:M20/M25/M40 family metallo-hydrolase [Gemmatimonadaceae bacterium]